MIDTYMDQNPQIHEEAAEWLIEFRAGEVDAKARAAFDAWLRLSPQHIRAYIELAARWEGMRAAASKEISPAADLIALARAEANVVELTTSKAPSGEMNFDARARRSRGALQRMAFAASLLLVCAAAAWYSQFRVPTYSTSVGEQRSIGLADGSVVQLNSRSRIRVRFGAAERDVELVDGQAMFEVAKDRNRPFVVRSGAAQVRAVGTQFDVYRQMDRTTVTVVEGTVAVSDGRSAEPATKGVPARPPATSLVRAGDQVVVTARALQTPTHVNVSAATAWTQHRLVFEETPLVQVAQEFSRYNTRRLAVEGSGLGDFHVSGVFSSTDPASLLRFLREQPGIIVIETDDEVRISRR